MNPDRGDYGQDSPGQVLGCAVGITVAIVLAILLPIFDMNQLVGR